MTVYQSRYVNSRVIFIFLIECFVWDKVSAINVVIFTWIEKLISLRMIVHHRSKQERIKKKKNTFSLYNNYLCEQFKCLMIFRYIRVNLYHLTSQTNRVS